MSSTALILVGKSSHVLFNFNPKKSYDDIFASYRDDSADNSSRINTLGTKSFFLDLKRDFDFSAFLPQLSEYNFIDIIFASYLPLGLLHTESTENVSHGLRANCIFPLKFFSEISFAFPQKKINSVFISSIYAHVSPNPKNYAYDSDINPLYYGVAKAGVECGLRWLSCQNPLHNFNIVALGPMPKPSVIQDSPLMIASLIESIPKKKLINHKDFHNAINFLLDQSGSISGETIFVDGGYTKW